MGLFSEIDILRITLYPQFLAVAIGVDYSEVNKRAKVTSFSILFYQSIFQFSPYL